MRFVVAFFAVLVLFVALSQVLLLVDLPQGAPALILGPMGLAALWLLQRALSPIGDRLADELFEGYTTLVMPFGGFTTERGRRDWRTGWRTPWDFDTVWVLDRRGGAVVRPPLRRGDSPGFYPSPTQPGSMELWTGVLWTGIYRQSG